MGEDEGEDEGFVGRLWVGGHQREMGRLRIDADFEFALNCCLAH